MLGLSLHEGTQLLWHGTLGIPFLRSAWVARRQRLAVNSRSIHVMLHQANTANLNFFSFADIVLDVNLTFLFSIEHLPLYLGSQIALLSV